MYAVEGVVLSTTPAVKVSTAGECLVYPVGAKPALNKPGTQFAQLITQSVKFYKVGVLSNGCEVQCSASSHWHFFGLLAASLCFGYNHACTCIHVLSGTYMYS